MDRILAPLETIVSKILIAFHWLLTTAGLPTDSGVTWALSIVGLVVVIRIILIPLFVKQIRAQRGLQLLQPHIKKIQELHKNDKQKQSAELMELYKREGTNPFASCLPILLQSPIFFALFRTLNGISHYAPGKRVPHGFTSQLASSARNAHLFGAQISDTFRQADTGAARAVALLLIVLMCATTFTTQRQVMTQNMPKDSMTGSTFAQQQKMMLYIFPLIFAVTGINFPIGVLIYWFTTNLWSMGQQFYVIRRSPAPGSPAHDALQERKRAKGLIAAPPAAGVVAPPVSLRKQKSGKTPHGGAPAKGSAAASTAGGPTGSTALPATGAARSNGQRPKRQQPRRQPRTKR